MARATPQVKPRIEVVDALRGLALLGLCLIHGIEHWDLIIRPANAPAWLESLDPIVHRVVFFLFAGKAYAIFSFMFGLSFFIQMDRQAERGVDFRWRFLWRLGLLGLIGYVHGLLYCGDVVVIFAVLGVTLVAFDRLGTKTLLVLSVLMVANLPRLYELLLVVSEPSVDPRPYELWRLYGRAFELFATGSLADVVSFNAWQGQLMKWGWYLQEGRIWQILGLFLWGMAAGRSRFFESIDEHRALCRKLLAGAAVAFAVFFTLRLSIGDESTSDNLGYLAGKLVGSYANLALTLVWITGFALLYQQGPWRRLLSSLAPLGRMSLTNYFGQSLVGVPFFYGFGLGMYRLWGHTLGFVFAATLIVVMIPASRVWLRHFHYGPLEWLWRVGTLMSPDVPFARRRSRSEVESQKEGHGRLMR
jgi:uncharacterized protein